MSELFESSEHADDKENLDQSIAELQQSIVRLMDAQTKKNSTDIIFQMEITLRHLTGILAGILGGENTGPEVIRRLQRDLTRFQFAPSSAKHALKRMYLMRHSGQKKEIEHAFSFDEWVQHLLHQIVERHRGGEPLDSVCNELLQLYPELSKNPLHFLQKHERQIDLAESTSDPLQFRQFPANAVVGKDYSICKLIAEGGMAEIYEATEKNLNRHVALKVVTSGDALSAERLRREAKIMANLKHKNIASIHSAFEHDQYFFVCMELLGEPMTKRLIDTPIRYQETTRIFADLAEATHYMHRQGIIHRDLTPDNILFDGDQPKITDFGLAVNREQETHLLTPGTGIGTICYVSPEQADGTKPAGTATDIYSLGAMLYEFLTRKPRFPNLDWKDAPVVLSRHLPTPPYIVQSNIPINLSEICMKCLAISPDERYHTAEELALALRAAMQGL